MILIVGDSKFIAQAYSRVLLGLGYRVLIACGGKIGLFAAENCNPSLILLDMLMPDARELQKNLKPVNGDVVVRRIWNEQVP